MTDDYTMLQRYLDMNVDENIINALSAELTRLDKLPGSYRHNRVGPMQFIRTQRSTTPIKSIALPKIRNIHNLNFFTELDLSSTSTYLPQFSRDCQYIYTIRENNFYAVSLITGLSEGFLPLPPPTFVENTIDLVRTYKIMVDLDDKYICISMAQKNFTSREYTTYIIKRTGTSFTFVLALPLALTTPVLMNHCIYADSITIDLDKLTPDLLDHSSISEENLVNAKIPENVGEEQVCSHYVKYQFILDKKLLQVYDNFELIREYQNVLTYTVHQDMLIYHVDRKKAINIVKLFTENLHSYSIPLNIKLPKIFNLWKIEFLQFSGNFMGFSIVRREKDDIPSNHMISSVIDLDIGCVLFKCATKNMFSNYVSTCFYNDYYLISDSFSKTLIFVNLKSLEYTTYRVYSHILGMTSREGFLAIVFDAELPSVQIFTDFPQLPLTRRSVKFPNYASKNINEFDIDFIESYVETCYDLCDPMYKLLPSEWGDTQNEPDLQPFVDPSSIPNRYPIATTILIDGQPFDGSLVDFPISEFHVVSTIYKQPMPLLFSKSSSDPMELLDGAALFSDEVIIEEQPEQEEESYQVNDTEHEETEDVFVASSIELSISEPYRDISEHEDLEFDMSLEESPTPKHKYEKKVTITPGSGKIRKENSYSREVLHAHFHTTFLLPHRHQSYFTTKEVLIKAKESLHEVFHDLFDYSEIDDELQDELLKLTPLKITVESLDMEWELTYAKAEFKSGVSISFVPSATWPIIFLPISYYNNLMALPATNLYVRPLGSHLFRLPINNTDLFPSHPHFDYPKFSDRKYGLARFYLKLKLALKTPSLSKDDHIATLEDIINDVTKTQETRLTEMNKACFDDWYYSGKDPDTIEYSELTTTVNMFKYAPIDLFKEIPYSVVYSDIERAKTYLYYDGIIYYQAYDLPVPNFNQYSLALLFFAFVKYYGTNSSETSVNHLIPVLKKVLMRYYFSYEEFLDDLLEHSHYDTLEHGEKIYQDLFSSPPTLKLALKTVDMAEETFSKFVELAKIKKAELYHGEEEDSFSDEQPPSSDEYIPTDEEEFEYNSEIEIGTLTLRKVRRGR